MTSRSDQTHSASGRVERKVTEALNSANARMNEGIIGDIAKARMNAIREAKAQKPKSWWGKWPGRRLQWSRYEFLVNNTRSAASLAVALIVTVLLSYNQNDTVPSLPAGLLTGDVPTEELAMLEDLEFASWLAEQQQEGLL